MFFHSFRSVILVLVEFMTAGLQETQHDSALRWAVRQVAAPKHFVRITNLVKITAQCGISVTK